MFHLIICTQKIKVIKDFEKIIFEKPDPSQPTWRTNQDKTKKK